MTAVQQPVTAAPARPAAHQRIDWIDTAKGLCMLLVIVGHTLPYSNLLRNFIFSFHMPAFFFLTGYTARRPDNKKSVTFVLNIDLLNFSVVVICTIASFTS